MALRKERVIVSETQLDSAATGATGPDAETGEAHDMTDYSEESGAPDNADVAEAPEEIRAEDASAEDTSAETEAKSEDDVTSFDGEESPDGTEAEEAEQTADSVREEFERELRMLPGDWYVVHSYAGYENRVKTNLESRIQSLNMEDYIFQIEVPVHQVTEIKGGKRQQVSEKVLPGYILVRLELQWSATPLA
jgi:transcriptional antiterminator NusG